MPIFVGITGNIGCGKSLVGELLVEQGVPVIDSDQLTHDLYANDKEVQEKIMREFGTLERKEIGKIVFADAEKRKILEGIIHPKVGEKMREWTKQHAGKPILANLIPLLFEAKFEDRYDKIICVYTDEAVQINRIKKRDRQLSDEDILKRINAQMPQEEKKARSHHVIDNSGTIEDTRKQVEELLNSLKAEAI